MPEHPNAALVRSLFTAFEKREIPAAIDLLSPDAVWRFPGTAGGLAGDHCGREAILAFLAKVMVLTNGTFRLELHDVLGSDSGAVALFTGSGQRDGKVLNNPTALVIAVRDGRIVELREFVWDLPHVEAFWS
jgi:ketosteroid isomerase-like protein